MLARLSLRAGLHALTTMLHHAALACATFAAATLSTDIACLSINNLWRERRCFFLKGGGRISRGGRLGHERGGFLLNTCVL